MQQPSFFFSSPADFAENFTRCHTVYFFVAPFFVPMLTDVPPTPWDTIKVCERSSNKISRSEIYDVLDMVRNFVGTKILILGFSLCRSGNRETSVKSRGEILASSSIMLAGVTWFQEEPEKRVKSERCAPSRIYITWTDNSSLSNPFFLSFSLHLPLWFSVTPPFSLFLSPHPPLVPRFFLHVIYRLDSFFSPNRCVPLPLFSVSFIPVPYSHSHQQRRDGAYKRLGGKRRAQRFIVTAPALVEYFWRNFYSTFFIQWSLWSRGSFPLVFRKTLFRPNDKA